MNKLFFGFLLLFSGLTYAAEINWNDFVYINQTQRLELQEKIIFPTRLIAPHTLATLESFEYLFHGAYMAVLQLTQCDFDSESTELELFTSRLYQYEYGAALEKECRLRIYITRDELDHPSLFHLAI